MPYILTPLHGLYPVDAIQLAGWTEVFSRSAVTTDSVASANGHMCCARGPHLFSIPEVPARLPVKPYSRPRNIDRVSLPCDLSFGQPTAL